MDILYLSPSLLPSRSANSIHVVHMCAAFAQLGHRVTLVANRSLKETSGLKTKLENFYGVDLGGVTLVTLRARTNAALTVKLGVFSFIYLMKKCLLRNAPDIVVSRNLYASYLLLSSKGITHIFETHQLEYGFRKILQKVLIRQQGIHKVVISRALRVILAEHHEYRDFDPLILHDAAPSGIRRQSPNQKKQARREILGIALVEDFKWLAGYFGHLYAGRGIELIKELAVRHPDVLFLIFGGNDEQIEMLSKQKLAGNFRIMGFIEPISVSKTASMMDVLLMPYQESVSIGGLDTDTARWMSPLKLFEYLASGVPIISSMLPSLAEVLKHEHNALIVRPNDVAQWSESLNRLTHDLKFAEQIASTAYSEYLGQHCWNLRAARMLHSVTSSP